nr:hypothetical protein [Maliibacterium massiliense]
MKRCDNYRRITHDVYFIAERLREIDPDYVLLYNNAQGRYEVHVQGPEDAFSARTCCLRIPYDALDARTLTLARRTRVARMAQVVQELDAHNAHVARQAAGARRAHVEDITEAWLRRHA